MDRQRRAVGGPGQITKEAARASMRWDCQCPGNAGEGTGKGLSSDLVIGYVPSLFRVFHLFPHRQSRITL